MQAVAIFKTCLILERHAEITVEVETFSKRRRSKEINSIFGRFRSRSINACRRRSFFPSPSHFCEYLNRDFKIKKILFCAFSISTCLFIHYRLSNTFFYSSLIRSYQKILFMTICTRKILLSK